VEESTGKRKTSDQILRNHSYSEVRVEPGNTNIYPFYQETSKSKNKIKHDFESNMVPTFSKEAVRNKRPTLTNDSDVV
jgi:hypothetical protein